MSAIAPRMTSCAFLIIAIGIGFGALLLPSPPFATETEEETVLEETVDATEAVSSFEEDLDTMVEVAKGQRKWTKWIVTVDQIFV